METKMETQVLEKRSKNDSRIKAMLSSSLSSLSKTSLDEDEVEKVVMVVKEGFHKTHLN